MTSYVELLLDPAGDPLTDEQRSIATAVQRGAYRLARLVDDLLVLAQRQSRSLRIDRARVDVSVAVLDEVQLSAGGTPEIRAEVQAGAQILDV